MLFGTSGIRGIYGKDITEELAYRIVNVFAEENDLVIGRDTRTTGINLEKACVQGINAAGKNALLLGIVPTPTVALATVKLNCNGIMITASHNPESYNGFKLFKDGREISRAEEREFEKKFNDKRNRIIKNNSNKFENADYDYTIIDDHKTMIKNLIDTGAISRKKPKVVVDCNGAAATITPYLLREIGCKVISMNAELQGFNRPSEPTKENLTALANAVKATNADLGIAHDGDGDRCIIIDDKGEILGLDLQLAMIIEHELKKNGKKNNKNKDSKNEKHDDNKTIVSTVEASLMIRETVENNKGSIIITPVSSVYVSEKLEKEKACFGGEPCGEYIFKDAYHHAPDGILAAAKFVEILAANASNGLNKLSELRKKYKTYPMLREKFKCENKNKLEVIKNIIKKINNIKNIDGKRNEEDGLRVDEQDGWFLIRASGTEPIIRLTMEYKDRKKLEERANELREIIKREL